ncbi:MAG: DUF721 domain-containing protein [FCB group bacterium]|nr:DUF721 domain-containing protein [FCB group bacterium]
MQSIKQALDNFLKTAGIEKAVNQNLALVHWNAVVGPVIAQKTEAVSIEHGVLVVKTQSPTWRQELQFKKQEILMKLNKQLGKNIVKDIRFV